MKKRLFSIFCALALCLALLPVTALAAEVTVDYIYYTWDEDTQTLSGPTKGTASATEVTADNTNWGSSDTGEHWYVVSGDVTIGGRINVTGDVRLILTDGYTLTANGGIQVAEGNRLTIYGQRENSGKLSVDFYSMHAAIGGNEGEAAGNIVIHGGDINVCSGNPEGTSTNGAGIGGGGSANGNGGDGGTVTIYGGTVNANSTEGGGAGIGGGKDGDAGSFSTQSTDDANGNAVIFASSIQDQTGKENWQGVIFQGGADGTIYDDSVTPAEDFTIPEGKTLTIQEGVTLTNDGTLTVEQDGKLNNNGILTNNGTILVWGTLNGTVEGSGTVTYKVTGVTLDRETLSLTVGGTGTLTATVVPSNATNQNVTWESSDNTVATVESNGTVTAVGVGETTITVKTEDGGFAATCTVTVRRSSSGSSAKTPSQQAADKIESAKEGATVEITLSASQTKLDKEVFEALSGRDVTLEISLPGGVTWTVNGRDIPADAVLTDLDLGVTMGTDTIPADLINALTGETGAVQLTLAHDGPFGFTMTLTAPLGAEYAGLWANLYRYDADTLTFQTAARIGADGCAGLSFKHASEYAVVIDGRSHALSFTDVAADAWYYDAVDSVCQNGLMSGTSATTFGPDGVLSRAQLCQILYAAQGYPAVTDASPFPDVEDGAWYADAVTWAAGQGIVSGYGGGLFGPDDPVTREQLAAILWRFAQARGYDVSVGEDTNILSYADFDQLSEYAVPAMQWACGAGIISGTGDGSTLSPRGEATRAQFAVMLTRFGQAYGAW